jgi:hypothetical protein
MKPTKTLFAATALLVALCASGRHAFAQTAAAAPAPAVSGSAAASYDQGGARYLLDHPRALARFLGLSSSQETAALALWNTLQTTVTPLRQARPALCQTLVTDLTAASPNPSDVGSATLSLFDNREQIVAAHQTFVAGFSALLDAQQVAAYDALRKLAFPGDEEYAVIGRCPHQTS